MYLDETPVCPRIDEGFEDCVKIVVESWEAQRHGGHVGA
jgi:hypothetical protein